MGKPTLFPNLPTFSDGPVIIVVMLDCSDAWISELAFAIFARALLAHGRHHNQPANSLSQTSACRHLRVPSCCSLAWILLMLVEVAADVAVAFSVGV